VPNKGALEYEDEILLEWNLNGAVNQEIGIVHKKPSKHDAKPMRNVTLAKEINLRKLDR
jgi:hypothetical protein